MVVGSGAGDWVGYWGNIVGGVLGAIVASMASISIMLTFQKESQREQTRYNYKMKMLFDESSDLLQNLEKISEESEVLERVCKKQQDLIDKLNKNDDKIESFAEDYPSLESLFNREIEDSIPFIVSVIKEEVDQIFEDPHYRLYIATIGKEFEQSLKEMEDALEKCDKSVIDFKGFEGKYREMLYEQGKEELLEVEKYNELLKFIMPIFDTYQFTVPPKLLSISKKLDQSLMSTLDIE